MIKNHPNYRMTMSGRGAALADPVTHSLVRKAGYIAHNMTPLESQSHNRAVAERRQYPGGRCSPPGSPASGSVHMLRSPGGNMLPFVWIDAKKAWARNGGFRMAYTADYLSRAGWTYVGMASVAVAHPLALPVRK